jgi:hypothetical protein
MHQNNPQAPNVTGAAPNAAPTVDLLRRAFKTGLRNGPKNTEKGIFPIFGVAHHRRVLGHGRDLLIWRKKRGWLRRISSEKSFVIPKHYSEPRTDLSTSRRAQSEATNSGFAAQTDWSPDLSPLPSDGAGRDRARPARADDDHRDDIRGKRDDADVEVADRLRQGWNSEPTVREAENRGDVALTKFGRRRRPAWVGLCGIRLMMTAGRAE